MDGLCGSWFGGYSGTDTHTHTHTGGGMHAKCADSFFVFAYVLIKIMMKKLLSFAEMR